jgi:glutaminyl-peptide cyclotransferase
MKINLLAVTLVLGYLIVGCSSAPPSSGRFTLTPQQRPVPVFSADSAYAFIYNQVQFGPRNPNSQAHRDTRDYLIGTLRKFAGERMVFAQNFTHPAYDEEDLELTNIIAAFNPSSKDRILLAAHWDTRPRAEEELNPDLKSEPILGADDGGSGVGVLLELARIFSETMPPVGVDILLFDGEDYGHSSDLDFYFLGARHWSANPPVPGYTPRFGILLDMVGAKDAQFPKEGFSLRYAAPLVDDIWRIATEMGYSNFFIPQRGGPVADDHMIVNQVAGIPMINIIHYYSDGQNVQFAPHWHTHNDTMDIISRETLQAVGNVLTEIIYNRIPPAP